MTQTIWDWNPYLVGGGTRPDAVTGLADPFEQALQSLFMGAPPEIQQNLRITSGYRSPEVQERLWNEALAKYGDPEIADNWVARPGKSNHNHGSAVDLKFLDPAAQEWAHANAAQYGLQFPMSHEPWHVEPIDRATGAPLAYSPPNPAQPRGILPDLSMGEPVTKMDALGLLGAALAKPQQQQQAPQMMQRQATPYTPQKRDPAAAYAQFFQTLR
jgi:hypothetical protein